MERILVISDTHGSPDKALEIFDKIPGITGVIHLGDYVRDAEKIENYIYPVPIYFVAGNNDFGFGIPDERLIEIGGKRIFLTHGHRYVCFNDISRLERLASEKKADAVLYGHTHKPYYGRKNGVLFANPGSTSYPRGSEPSYGIIEIENRNLGYDNIFI